MPRTGPTSKQDVREDVWAALQAAGVARFPGARGRIPNFTGAEKAAERLAGLDEWQRASALKCNPDLPQLPVRARALADGKLVYLSVPRLREPDPFLLLDPARLDVAPRKAASIKGSGEHGVPAGLDDLPHLDLVVCGSVAVTRAGQRIGKGGGYADLELALATEAGLVDDDTIVVTTVHPLQVVDGTLPQEPHDLTLDLIVTPDEVIRCTGPRTRAGLDWGVLDDEKIAAIPVLARRNRPN